MKLATFVSSPNTTRVGLVQDGTSLLDLAAAAQRDGRPEAAFRSMLALIDGGEALLQRARALAERFGGEPTVRRELAKVKLLSPVPRPRQIRDFSVFPGHVRGAPAGMQRLAARLEGKPPPDAQPAADVPPVYRAQPIYYKANRFSVVGHDETVRWPRYSRFMDYELELGVFLGKGGADIPAARAREHIFGYAIFNDFSARDAQLLEMRGMLGPAKGKDFDTGNAIGPWIVTADEIPDPYSLRMSARINGEIWSEGTSSGMLHSFEDMIAFVSRDETLHPGEFFGSGTIGGGCGLELDRYLAHDDTVELEVEKIGILQNKVVRQDQ